MFRFRCIRAALPDLEGVVPGVFHRVVTHLACFLFCLFSLCPEVRAEEAPEPIKIGAILHLTGDLAMAGNAFREGIDVAVGRINKVGGVNGRPVRVLYEDTGFDTSRVNRAAKKLIEQDRVAAAIISTFHESKTAGPLFERAKIPLLCLWDSTPELDAMGKYLFSIGTWLPSTGTTSARFAFNNLARRRAAVISTNREWSLKVGTDFAETFEALGGEISSHLDFNPGEADFRSMFAKVKKGNPDVLYAPVDDNVAAFFKQLRQSGLDIPVLQSDNLNQEFVNSVGSDVEGVYQSQSIEPTTKEARDFAAEYRAKFGKDPTQLLYQAWGFDGMNVLARAAATAGSDSDGIAKGLYQIRAYPGAIGLITISEDGSHKLGVSMFQIQKGQFVRLSGVDTESIDVAK